MTRRALLAMPAAATAAAQVLHKPLRLGLAGLVHGHVKGLFNALKARPDIQLCGIAEDNRGVMQRYQREYSLDGALLFQSLAEMLDRAQPEAVVIFTNTFDHLRVVEACASRHIHCMMEKPLAVSVAHGQAMAAAARRGNIHVLVNYETTWYANNQLVQDLVLTAKKLGDIRRIVVRDGHKGPKEIGVEPEFLDFLTDPIRNGGGALYDFGCYGANLMTWLMEGQRPVSVTAVTQQIKPNIYPKVEDEATIVLAYPHTTGIIEASWNWPVSRKDMEIYGPEGYLLTVKSEAVRLRLENTAEVSIQAKPYAAPRQDFLSYLAAVTRGQIEPEGLSSLRNNLIVTEILEAARRSAATGTTVRMAPRASLRNSASPTAVLHHEIRKEGTF